jgi:general nucleoside transport system permease protein
MGAFFFGGFQGILVGVVAGALVGLLIAILTVRLGVDQMVAGLVATLLFTAVTSFFLRIIFYAPGRQSYPTVSAVARLNIPILEDIPILGPALFRQDAVLYIAILLVPICWFVLFKTKWGLIIRAVGENPRAADVMGIKVYLTRYTCVVISGALAGLGGAHLSLIDVGTFRDGMTLFRGFIAIVIVIFANWKPQNAIWASLMFGFNDALQLRLQSMLVTIPYQFFLALPYLVVIVLLILAATRGRLEVPSSLLTHYRRES